MFTRNTVTLTLTVNPSTDMDIYCKPNPFNLAIGQRISILQHYQLCATFVHRPFNLALRSEMLNSLNLMNH